MTLDDLADVYVIRSDGPDCGLLDTGLSVAPPTPGAVTSPAGPPVRLHHEEHH